jgi:ATP-dependent DNA ligase
MKSNTVLYKKDSKGKIRTFSVEVDGGRYRLITGLKDGKQVTSAWTNCLPKHVGKSNERTSEEQAIFEANARYEKKLKEHYFKSEEEALNSDDAYFKVMLASTGDKALVIKLLEQHGSIILDPKLDGMRMTMRKKAIKSRKGRDISTMGWLFEKMQPYLKSSTIVLDGELYNHDYKDDFEGLMSLFRREHISAAQQQALYDKAQYHVYDYIDEANPANALNRKIMLNTFINSLPPPLQQYIKYVPGYLIHTLEEYEQKYTEIIKNGYEGAIIRIPDSEYVGKRSKNLLKIKDFFTEEFTIIDILPGKGNAAGMAARVIVDVNGNEVGCGIKMSWDKRKKLLQDKFDLIGSDASIRYFQKTNAGSLRFPVCYDVQRWHYE